MEEIIAYVAIGRCYITVFEPFRRYNVIQTYAILQDALCLVLALKIVNKTLFIYENPRV